MVCRFGLGNGNGRKQGAANMEQYGHTVTAENAARIAEWLRTRGGIAVWESISLSNPGASWTTPVNDADGKPVTKPTWEAENDRRIYTDPAAIGVSTDVECRRFHVAIRRGATGFMVKLTDASTAKVRKAVEAAGDGAYYQFDYDTQEAVIMRPNGVESMADWMARN